MSDDIKSAETRAREIITAHAARMEKLRDLPRDDFRLEGIAAMGKLEEEVATAIRLAENDKLAQAMHGLADVSEAEGFDLKDPAIVRVLNAAYSQICDRIVGPETVGLGRPFEEA